MPTGSNRRDTEGHDLNDINSSVNEKHNNPQHKKHREVMRSEEPSMTHFSHTSAFYTPIEERIRQLSFRLHDILLKTLRCNLDVDRVAKHAYTLYKFHLLRLMKNRKKVNVNSSNTIVYFVALAAYILLRHINQGLSIKKFLRSIRANGYGFQLSYKKFKQYYLTLVQTGVEYDDLVYYYIENSGEDEMIISEAKNVYDRFYDKLRGYSPLTVARTCLAYARQMYGLSLAGFSNSVLNLLKNIT